MTAQPPPSPILLPWGSHDVLPLEIPASWTSQVVWPDLSGGLTSYGDALSCALDQPLDCPRLESQVQAGSKVAIVVDDPSRWTPVQEAIPEVLRRLHNAGVRPEDITISVGVGRHHAVNDSAMRKRVGTDVVDHFRCFSPPVNDLTAYVDLGTTPDGLPVRVFRPVVEADLRILIGSVLPHMQAGFGGGYKLIFPGTSHRSTLGALHSMGLGGDASRLLGGDRQTNPMR